jgi:hypothetical protein
MNLMSEKRGRFTIQEIDSDDHKPIKRVGLEQIYVKGGRHKSSHLNIFKLTYNLLDVESDQTLESNDKLPKYFKCEVREIKDQEFVDFEAIWNELIMIKDSKKQKHFQNEFPLTLGNFFTNVSSKYKKGENYKICITPRKSELSDSTYESTNEFHIFKGVV